MTIYKEFNVGGKGSPFGSFGPMIGLILFLALAYFMVKGVFTILGFLAPFLLLGAAILDYTVITDFVKFVLKLLKENPLMGLVAILLVIIGFPAVFGFLFFKAYARRKFKNFAEKVEKEKGRFDEYEEVKSTTKKDEEDDFLILPKIEKPVVNTKSNSDQKSNDYNDLFK
jgi:Na+-transporting methylmalonyl-CoA/oxaloacetate decarboxylase gamma subunit